MRGSSSRRSAGVTTRCRLGRRDQGSAGRPVSSFLVTVVAVLTTMATGSFAFAADWPAFRFDATHSGLNPAENAIAAGNVGALATAWTAPTGNGVFSSPAVANGRAYVGSDDGKLYAFDAAGATNCAAGPPRTCSPLWTAATGGAVRSSPAVANGNVYVGSDDGKLYAFDAEGAFNCAAGPPMTCLARWVTATGALVRSSPAVANGVVYVGSDDAGVYALNATTGQVIWKTITGAAVRSSPAVANGVVYVGSDDKGLYALDAATGAVLWKTITGAAVRSSPAVANGAVYVGSDDAGLYALNATTGQVLWKTTTGASVRSSPAVSNGVVYVGSDDTKVYGVDATTGAVRWTAPLAAIVRSSPAVANGLVYVGSDGGSLSVFDALGSAGCSGVPTVCSPLRAVPTGGSVRSSPGVANGVVYVGSADSRLYAIGPPAPPPCTRTLTGDVLGPVTVGSTESVCITNARVIGPVTVNTGGALTVDGSRITNGVVATSPSYFSLCGSQVAAPPGNAVQGVVVTGGGSPARVGDPQAGCAGNRVAGDVILTGAAGGLTLGANTVSGNVRVDDNPSLAVVKANTIFATLACSGNSPPPTNAGQPNTASAKTGQCAAL
jgi:outer membrane protein assembly factor BamB